MDMDQAVESTAYMDISREHDMKTRTSMVMRHHTVGGVVAFERPPRYDLWKQVGLSKEVRRVLFRKLSPGIAAELIVAWIGEKTSEIELWNAAGSEIADVFKGNPKFLDDDELWDLIEADKFPEACDVIRRERNRQAEEKAARLRTGQATTQRTRGEELERRASRVAEENASLMREAHSLGIPEAEFQEALDAGHGRARIAREREWLTVLENARQASCEVVVVAAFREGGIDLGRKALIRARALIVDAKACGLESEVCALLLSGDMEACESLLVTAKTSSAARQAITRYEPSVRFLGTEDREMAESYLATLRATAYGSRDFRKAEHDLGRLFLRNGLGNDPE